MRLDTGHRDRDVDHAQWNAHLESIDSHNRALVDTRRHADANDYANALPDSHAVFNSRTQPHFEANPHQNARPQPNPEPHRSRFSNSG